MLEIKLIESTYDSGRPMLTLILAGVEVLPLIHLDDIERVRAAIVEHERDVALMRAQAIAYQLMNERLTETVQALRHSLVSGCECLQWSIR